MTSNNNVGPRNGKIIGYICNGAFIKKTENVDVAPYCASRMLQYGAAALIHKECSDIYEDLLKVYNIEEANRLMTIASLRVTDPGIDANRYAHKASESYISILYPCRGLTSNSVTSFLEKLGEYRDKLLEFYSLRMSRVMSDHNVIIDGVLKQDTADNSLSVPLANVCLKDHQEFSVIYAYDQQLTEPICCKVYQGNMLDAQALRDFVIDNNINKGIIVCDKGLPILKIRDVLESRPDLHCIAPLKRNDALIKEHSMLQCDQVATSLKGKLVMYKKANLDNGMFLYTIRDCERSNNEQLGELYQALDKCESVDAKAFNDAMATRGTITFLSDLDLDPLVILNHYDNRGLLETVFEHFKNTLDLVATRDQSKFSVIGNEFVNFLASLQTCKIITAFKSLEATYGTDPSSIRSHLSDLRDVDRNSSAPFRGDINDGYWNLPAHNPSMRLLVELDLADDATGIYSRKKRSDDATTTGIYSRMKRSDDATTGTYSRKKRSDVAKTRQSSKASTAEEVYERKGLPDTSTALEVVKRGRGRPRGSRNRKTIEFERQFIGPPAPKMKLGRPSTQKRVFYEHSSLIASEDASQTRRKPGRPKGSRNKKTIVFEAQFVGPLPDLSRLKRRGPGRPAGAKNKISSEFKRLFIGPMPDKTRLSKRGRGRPRKEATNFVLNS